MHVTRGSLMDPDPGAGGAGGGGNAGGAGADPKPEFDPAKFRGELMAEVTKMLNGGIARLEKQLSALKPKEPDPEPEPKDPDKPNKAERELAKLRADLEAEKKARMETEARAKEERRLSAIRTEIAKHGLADHSIDDAFRYFRDEVKYSEDGSLVGGADEQPLADFVKSVCEKRTHWLPPKPAGGAGATAGRGGKGAAVTLDQIKPGMTAEQRAAALAAIQQAGAGLGQ